MPYATLNGHRVHYYDSKEQGLKIDNGKLPIIMIHGLGSSENYYLPVIPLLDGHRCVAMTTYGAALSNSQGEELSLKILAEDVASLLDHLKIEQAIVAGHSMGGPMAFQVAALHPDKVAGVVAIGPVNPSGVKPEMFTQRIETVNKSGMEPLANTVPGAATNKKSTHLQKAMIRELIINQDPKAYASHCEVIINMKDPGFSSIQTPVLILAGDEDQSAPMEGCKAIFESIASEMKELRVLPGVGHWHCIEAPERVAKDIAYFASALLQLAEG
ncbi:3-oxoadipate enol-lactonase 2 [Lecanosticta acicola]|uniref:3-oxoadipate enol-lactonase 2 n=1 Tax=Lecanosticta acicola TaxID=111012 RepID=A0AAI8YWZ8_9PEZI|nr:3-oxoadipate enol-lactonase 2 [Lecanosticta acicola]